MSTANERKFASLQRNPSARPPKVRYGLFSEVLEDYLTTREDHQYRQRHGYSCAETWGRLQALRGVLDQLVGSR